MDQELVLTTEELNILISALDNRLMDHDGIYRQKMEKLMTYLDAKLKESVALIKAK